MNRLPHPPDWRRLLVVVGPSGAGKDTVLRLWRERLAPGDAVAFARRVLTRPADPQGEGHEPATGEQFAALRDTGQLAFEWQAHGLQYGVRVAALESLRQGGWLVLNGSRHHLPVLQQQAPGCRVVEVTAPAATLQTRLLARGREDRSAVRDRLQRPAPQVRASLSLVNDGAAAECAAALHAWWSGLVNGLRPAAPDAAGSAGLADRQQGQR